MLQFLIIFLLLLAAVIIFLALQEGRYSIQRSKTIDADIDTVFAKIKDFKTWPEWSPWLIHEPDTKLNYSGSYWKEGGSYSWDGRMIGAGKITHIKFDTPNRIEQQLEFYRPFKSVCTTGFEMISQEGKTELTWTMQGKMPFFMRFLTKRIKEMTGKDFELGLAMLNGRLAPNAERPEISFEGEVSLEPKNCLYSSFSGPLAALIEEMKVTYPKLMTHVQNSNGRPTGAPFAAYHKIHCKTMEVVCDMAVPVTEGMAPGEFKFKSIGGGKYYKVVAKGSYQFLGLVWHSAMSHVFMLKVKMDKSRPSLEVYENDPEQVAHSNEIMTTLYIPIK